MQPSLSEYLSESQFPRGGQRYFLLLFLFLMVTVTECPVNKNTTASPLAPPVASYGKATSIHTNVTFLLCSAVLKSTAGSPRADNQLYLVNEMNLTCRFIYKNLFTDVYTTLTGWTCPFCSVQTCLKVVLGLGSLRTSGPLWVVLTLGTLSVVSVTT